MILNSFSSFLRKPLPHLLLESLRAFSFEESSVKKIFILAKACLLAIPYTASSLLGRCIALGAPFQVNWDHLADSPVDVIFPSLGDINKNEGGLKLQIKNISNAYNAANPGDEKGLGSLQKLCETIEKRNLAGLTHIMPQLQGAFLDDMSVYLFVIGSRIANSPKRGDYLQRLKDASLVCSPTWLEEARSIAKEMLRAENNRSGVQDDLLAFVQDYKETLILGTTGSIFKAEWHMLNVFRNTFSKEFGLSVGSAVFDDAGQGEIWGVYRKVTQLIFREIYSDTTPLVGFVFQKLAALSCLERAPFHDALVKFFREKGYNNPEEIVAAVCYDSDYNLKPIAAAYLLQSVGILR